MIADALSCLACPVCGEGFALEGGALRCANGHAFDIAREGYANLLGGKGAGGTADTPAMVHARAAFLAGGWYEPIADAVADAVAEAAGDATPGCLVEVGAGTGYHLARALARAGAREGIAVDLSKHAARVAARAHPRIAALVADAWARLPLRDGGAAAVLDVFAPRNADEIARVLAPGGALVVVTPTPRHLAELVGTLGLVTVDPEKDARLAAQLAERFEPVATRAVERALELPHTAVRDLVAMGPSARHLDAAELDRRVTALPEPVDATLSVTVGTYRKRQPLAESRRRTRV